MTKVLRIDVWSDVVCPWCWIGLARLRAALAMPGAPSEAVLVWHAYELDPDAGTAPIPLREAYARKFGADRVEQLLAQTQQAGRAEGLPIDYGRGQVRVSTFDAHRVMWLAGREGKASAVAEALFAAHFAQGLNLSDPQVLADAGAQGGLARDAVLALLSGDEGAAQVRAEVAQAQGIGIRAVPAYLLDGRLMVQGAQPAAAWQGAFAQLAAMSSTER